MRTDDRKRKTLAAVALALGLVLAGEPAARADTGAAQPDATSGGIQVHGHWTIEVRNPDGSLASRREFENALVPGEGDAALARMFNRNQMNWKWVVEVGEDSPSGTGGPCRPAVTPPNGRPCTVRQPDVTVTVAGETVRLSGAVTAQQASDVSRFATLLDAVHNGGTITRFTEKRLPAPVSVAAGQVIQVTVVFSFS